MMSVDNRLAKAVAELWRAPYCGGDFQTLDQFRVLAEACAEIYGKGSARFALATAIRSLGAPCAMSPDRGGLECGADEAVIAIDAAFRQTQGLRRYVCPLDLADELPQMSFGSSRVRELAAQDVRDVFGGMKIDRIYGRNRLDAAGLAQFKWLIVEEDYTLDPRPEARSFPALFSDLQRDFGAIDPHLGQFPIAVEHSLGFLLMAPWEDWMDHPDIDWRGFRVPWIYRVEEDLFAHVLPPPAPDSLSTEPYFQVDRWGEEHETERPSVYGLADDAAAGLEALDAVAWRKFDAARAGPLFETPVMHFFVRAFSSGGMDEFLAHVSTIEAAVGWEMDHARKGTPHAHVGATKRVAARLAALLSDPTAVNAFEDVFRLRSQFVHGRAGLSPIPSGLRLVARKLARRTVEALVDRSAALGAQSREVFLAGLLDEGVQYL